MSSISNANPLGSPLPDGDLPYDITRPSRRIIATEAQELKHRRELAQAKQTAEQSTDRIEVSAEAEALLRRGQVESSEGQDERKQRIADLRQRYLEGRLATNESVEEAATKMLGGGVVEGF